MEFSDPQWVKCLYIFIHVVQFLAAIKFTGVGWLQNLAMRQPHRMRLQQRAHLSGGCGSRCSGETPPQPNYQGGDRKPPISFNTPEVLSHQGHSCLGRSLIIMSHLFMSSNWMESVLCSITGSRSQSMELGSSCGWTWTLLRFLLTLPTQPTSMNFTVTWSEFLHSASHSWQGNNS